MWRQARSLLGRHFRLGATPIWSRQFAACAGGSAAVARAPSPPPPPSPPPSFSAARLGFSSAAETPDHAPPKLFADYSLYKGKAALSMRPTLPRVVKQDFKRSKFKSGSVILTFIPSMGVQQYDWQRRQMFALQPTEIGHLICLGPSESCEFFHDPAMKSSSEGQVRKTLSVKPMPNDTGYFVTLTIVDSIKNINERFSLPVTKAEFTVMRTTMSFALPHIMGWNLALASGSVQPQKEFAWRPDPEAEWSK